MIIQIKSSYSGGVTYNLEEKQELYISHTPETHAYVQKTADANAVARLYLLDSELHLAPVSGSGNIFLQNRPFTEDTVLGHESLLQIKENVLLFQIDGEVVILMMGLVLGYGNTASGKNAKVRDLTPTTPSRNETTEPSKGVLLSPTIQSGKTDANKAHEGERALANETGAHHEHHEMSEADILLLSESSTTTLADIQKSFSQPVVAKSGKGKWVAIAACAVIALSAAAWYILMKNPVAPCEQVEPVAGKTKTVEIENVGKPLGTAPQTENKTETDRHVSDTTVAATVKTEVTTPSANEQVAATTAVTEQKAVESQTAQKIAEPKVEPKVVEPQDEQAKPAVTLEERLALAKQELEELSKTVNTDDAPPELLEDKRFGQDVDWMIASFDKLKVSLRKVQIRELEKQMAVYQRAKNLDLSKFNEAATADFQKRFKEYTVKNYWGGANKKDTDFSREIINELQKGQINPNVAVVDSAHSRYSGPLLSCIFSGRIELSAEIAHELLKLGANSDVHFSESIRLLNSDAWTVVLNEGGINRMEGFLLRTISYPDFYRLLWPNRDMHLEDLVARLIILKHNLVERDSQDNTPLHYATKIGCARLVALMLLDGADVNVMNKKGETPLHLALKYGHLQLEALLLRNGANPTLKTVNGESVDDCRKVGIFLQDIEKKNYLAVRKALEADMSPNLFLGNNITILHKACRENDAELAKLLLEFNADTELAGTMYPLNMKPLAWALEEKSLDVFELLLANGADPNIRTSFSRDGYLLPRLCERGRYIWGNDTKKGLRWFEALLNAKKAPQLIVNNQDPVIRLAFDCKMDNDFVSLLLAKYESFPSGSDVVSMALFKEYPDYLVEELIKKKADVNAIFTIPNYTRTSFGDKSAMEPPRAGKKTTALWLAVEQNRPKIVELLLKNGADVNWKDADGKTVKDLPCSDEIKQMLQNSAFKETGIGKKNEKTGKETSVDGREFKTISLPGGVELKLMKIEAGSFMMGSDGRSNEGAAHKVTLTQDFWLGETEVTQRQYEMVMGDNPSYFKKGEDYPVETVSWDDAMEFCKKLTEQERKNGRISDKEEYTLPTEAQWEYACRAGTMTAWHYGNSLSSDQANFNGNYPGGKAAKGKNLVKTTPAKNYKPNTWGLYDMHGNVWEWCRDWYGRYPSGAVTDPQGLSNGSHRVTRGGSWHDSGRGCRSALRGKDIPTIRNNLLGFRVALVPVDSNTSASSGDVNKIEAETKKSDEKTVHEARDEKIEYKTIILPGDVKLKLIKIEPGSFANTELKKKITLTREYWIGETEVTQDQYAAIMEGVVNEKGMSCNPRPSYFKGDDRLPVENVSWYDAKAFCKKLNSLFEGQLPQGYQFNLPTEAQWEFASHGGNKSEEYMFSHGNYIERVAWYNENSEQRTHPVGMKQANELGLYDMSGNVLEWCRDWFFDWNHDPETLTGMKTALYRIFRGGAWRYPEWECSLSARRGGDPMARCNYVGFRVALVPVDSKTLASSDDANKNEGGMKVVEEKVIVNALTTAQSAATGWDGKDKVVDLGNGVTMVLKPIPKGSFMMGSPMDELGREADEKQHQVILTKDFWMGKYEATQRQYEAVMGTNPSRFKKGGDYPVEMVSWDDAMSFCKKLTEQERKAGRLPNGYEFSLPTEAQWEYACRAGTTTALNRGKNLTREEYNCANLDEVGWYTSNSGNSTHPVGQKKPNAWGLYDMHGNVWEWCREWYGSYPDGAATDPTGPMNGSYRVVRGGSWDFIARLCRPSCRGCSVPADRGSSVGFRVALVPVH